MATPLTDAINALTSYANSVTGEQDENLSDAVRSLADGYDDGSVIASLLDGTFAGEYRNDAPMDGIKENKISYMQNITAVILPNLTGLIGRYGISDCPNIKKLDIRNVDELTAYSLRNLTLTEPLIFLKPITIRSGPLAVAAKEVRMCQLPTSIASNAGQYRGITDLYMGFSEAEAIEKGYPWGWSVTHAHFDTVFDSKGNIISST